eukprot:5957780-Pleurochrysis_carterae.AAC.1
MFGTGYGSHIASILSIIHNDQIGRSYGRLKGACLRWHIEVTCLYVWPQDRDRLHKQKNPALRTERTKSQKAADKVRTGMPCMNGLCNISERFNTHQVVYPARANAEKAMRQQTA